MTPIWRIKKKETERPKKKGPKPQQPAKSSYYVAYSSFSRVR